MKCLFVIDVQNGFVSERTKHVVPRIRELAEAFEGVVIATKFVNNEHSPYENYMGWKRLKESPETDVLPEIEKTADYVIEKNIYSACVDEVMQIIDSQKIDKAYVVGIDTDCCVLKTATDLFERNIRPIVLLDYCASNGGEDSHRAAIRVMERTIGKNQIVSGLNILRD